MKSLLSKGLSQSDAMLVKVGTFLMILCVIGGCTKQPTSHHNVRVTQKTPVELAKNKAVVTPERSAAQNLTEEGVAAMNNKQNDKAIDLFQEAISVDPSYGVSYLELAKIKLDAGNLEESQNLLEKATSLLNHEPDWETVWLSEIDRVKSQLP